MESESARMSSAAQARFRIDYPNSKPRVVKVIALDGPSERVVKRVAEGAWQRATFFTSLKFDGAPRGGEGWTMQAWLSDLAGRTKTLVDEVASADLVVMVASAGTSAQAAAVIGEACAVRKVMTTALIIGSEHSIGRGTIADAGEPASLRVDAGDRDWRRLHRRDAGRAAGVNLSELRGRPVFSVGCPSGLVTMRQSAARSRHGSLIAPTPAPPPQSRSASRMRSTSS